MADAELINLLPEWLAFSKNSPADPGVSREEAVALATDVLKYLEYPPDEWPGSYLDQEKMKDVFHALISEVLPRCSPNIRVIDAAYRLTQGFPWRPDERAEKLELSRDASNLGWRLLGMDSKTVRQLRMTASDPHVPVPGGINELINAPRDSASIDLFGRLDQSAAESICWLFGYCRQLWKRFEYGVSPVHRESAEAWARLSGFDRLGIFDEGPFFLGELARLAGVACRLEGLWEEAEQWFERAEKQYVQTLDADVGLAQVAYARIGLLYHRYEYAAVLENAERLSPILDHLGMHSRAEKTRLAAVMALKSLGRVDEAIVLCEQLVERRGEHSPPWFLLQAYTHLADAYKERGRIPEADRCIQEGARQLALCERSIAAADFRLVYADHFRARGDFSTAAEIFAQAREGYLAVGMRPFAAYASVLLAETLMALDRRAAAESELCLALPVLEELKMLPEGCAAVALLQEALKLRRLDHDVLRAFRTSLKM